MGDGGGGWMNHSRHRSAVIASLCQATITQKVHPTIVIIAHSTPRRQKPKRPAIPTLPQGHPCSTIGAMGLNFSVRNGKRWVPHAIVTGQNGDAWTQCLNALELTQATALKQCVDFAY